MALIEHLARGLAPVRVLDFWYETFRSTGPRYVWRRWREDAALAEAGADRADDVYRSLWTSAADQLGADVVQLPNSVLEIRQGEARTRVRHNVTEIDDDATLRVASNRALVHQMLSSAGIPVPDYVEFGLDDMAPALGFLHHGAGPYVVKPEGSGGGKGVTTGVDRPAELIRASLRASRLAERLVIERQVSGTVHRMLVLDGELIDVVRYLPPRVMGDGRSTIGALIAAENRRRLEARGHARRKVLKADLDATLTLKRQGLTLRSVPLVGAIVQVKGVTNQNRLEDNETYRGPLSDELVATVLESVRVVGLRLAGADVLTADPSSSLEDAGGVIIEVNGTPGLDHHYLVADRANATPVCVPVLARLLAAARCENTQPA